MVPCFKARLEIGFTSNMDLGLSLRRRYQLAIRQRSIDIVNLDKKIAIECKRYTWTETGNVPSTKIGFTNEAAFYLSFLPDSYEKYIVMLRSHHEKRNESLAEYYSRSNMHLIGKTKVAEYDPECDELRIISADNE
ncbi:hypothetical protein D7Y41_03890 [Anaerotruncus sp. 1XD22-93]|nr:hypothetical protein [Lachnospiraceae bacterium]NBI74033.1 hypothetical protein [Lachnospiraceae bacterium]RKK00252.1 hypothetical protein D7Y41_03890 [Anaerotruncus sp. 1XD22-93]